MGTSLLSAHMDQISMCATSISELEFAETKMFTNAMLARHDITALIRDTEVHERALFSIAPPSIPSRADLASSNGSSAPPRVPATPHPSSRQPKRNTAVAAVLGRDLFRRVREADASSSANASRPDRPKGSEVDVAVLLEGAARLCDVYPLPGAVDEISQLRARHEQLSANIAHYEDRTARNAEQLGGMYQRQQGWTDDEGELADDHRGLETAALPIITKEELMREEREIAELERKKKGLEKRVSEMDKDLGGLLR